MGYFRPHVNYISPEVNKLKRRSEQLLKRIQRCLVLAQVQVLLKGTGSVTAGSDISAIAKHP